MKTMITIIVGILLASMAAYLYHIAVQSGPVDTAASEPEPLPPLRSTPPGGTQSIPKRDESPVLAPSAASETRTAQSTDPAPGSLQDRDPGQSRPALEPAIREALGRMLNTSSEGLVETTREGVTGMDLRGRFQTAPVATLGENGDVQITDYSHLPTDASQP